MKLSFVTLFPDLCLDAMRTGVLGRGVEAGKIQIEAVQIRDFSQDSYGSVDDTPYGGGPGMVLRAEPVVEAVESIERQGRSKVILMGPGGVPFTQSKAKSLTEWDHLIFICGRYEGIDERVRQCLELEEISVGDYVLTGGELPACIVADACCRLIPGVLGEIDSTVDESFSDGCHLEYPQYTRPREYRGHSVPDVLLSGHHADIQNWRKEQSEQITKERRPDLFNSLMVSSPVLF